jgi:FkbM family methyltransferase
MVFVTDQLSTDYPPCGAVAMLPAARRKILLDGIDLVIDGGANEGQYGMWLRQHGYTGRIVSFEPVAAAYAQLAARAGGDPSWDCRRLALGDCDGETIMNVSKDTTGSSRFMPEPVMYAAWADNERTGTESVEMRTLASLWPELVQRHERVYLKLDVEGSELAVLRAAGNALQTVQFVEAELHVTPMYRGAPTLDRVLAFMLSNGFGIVALEHNGGDDSTTGQMLMVDGVFRNVTGTRPSA